MLRTSGNADEQDVREIDDTGALAALVEKGLHHAIRRFDAEPAIRENLEMARIAPAVGLDSSVRTVPPHDRGVGGCVEFSPALVARMRREHRYPEWVLSAAIERCVRKQAAAWAARPGVRSVRAERRVA